MWWVGFMVPASTPTSFVKKIRDDTVKVLAMSDTKGRFAAQGMTPVGNTSKEFKKDIQEESKRWAKIIADWKVSIK